MVNYEKLVKNPEEEVRRICSYLKLPYSPALIQQFSGTVFTGRFGDPTGVKKYTDISAKPLRLEKGIEHPLPDRVGKTVSILDRERAHERHRVMKCAN